MTTTTNYDDQNARDEHIIRMAQRVREAYERGDIPQAEYDRVLAMANDYEEIRRLKERVDSGNVEPADLADIFSRLAEMCKGINL